MSSCTFVLLLVTMLSATGSHAVGITDIVWWGADMLAGAAAGEQRDGSESEAGVAAPGPETPEPEPHRTCHCSGPACMCCLDFNMTYIDLGGPGCVRLRYVGDIEGVAMNVSYGDSLLHSEVVKGAAPAGTCMDILSSLAQVCARFRSLEALSEEPGAKRGCLQLEPTLLGEVQASYSVGCFRMTPQAMTLEPSTNSSNEAPSTGTTVVGPNPTTEISAESLIAAVSETAEHGIDLLTNWLGLALEEDANSTATETQSQTQESTSTEENTSARSLRQGILITDIPKDV